MEVQSASSKEKKQRSHTIHIFDNQTLSTQEQSSKVKDFPQLFLLLLQDKTKTPIPITIIPPEEDELVMVPFLVNDLVQLLKCDENSTETLNMLFPPHMMAQVKNHLKKLTDFRSTIKSTDKIRSYVIIRNMWSRPKITEL